jgi:hypothetical protein
MSTDYNAATWSAADLLTEVYRACAMPDTGTVDWTPAAVLREATNVIWSFAGPALAKAREGRLATSLLRAVTTDALSVSGQDYELPPMAVGDTLDSVSWVDASGKAKPLDVIPLGLEDMYSSPQQTGEPQYFDMQADLLRILPRPSSTGSLRITYQRRHSELVALGTDNATVNSVVDNGGFARVTLSTTPAAFGAGAWVDFIGVRYPHRTKLHGAVIVTAHGSSQFTLSTTLAAFNAAKLIGDTAVTYGKTPYVQLPLELRSALNSKIAAKITGFIGDVGMSQLHQVGAQDEMVRAKDALSPRTKSARQKAVNPRSIARSCLPRGIPRWNRSDG